MKSTVAAEFDFDLEDFDHLRSASCDAGGISLWRVLNESCSEHAMHLDWDEWDALIKVVARYRAMKAQSEAA